MTWRWSNPTPHGNNIFDLAEAGGLFVEVCDQGQVYTSDDLITWMPRASHTTNALRAVTFFGNRLVITGANGTVLFADTLNNIQPGNLLDGPTTDWLEAVAANPNLLVAVGDHAAIYTSTDGMDWARQSVGFTNWLRGAAWGLDKFVAVGEAGLVASSADGVNWQSQKLKTTGDLNRVAWLNSAFIAVGEDGKAYSSPNGKSWSEIISGATNNLFACAANSHALLVTGDEELRLQNNLQSWTNELDPGRPFSAPSWTYLSSLWVTNNDGLGLFLLGGRTGMTVAGFQTNLDGRATWHLNHDCIRNWLWEIKRTPLLTTATGECATLRTNFYITVGDVATIMTSDDGLRWEIEPVPTTVTNAVFLGVGASTNGLVVAGSNGSLIFSPNQFVEVVITNSEIIEGVTNQVFCTNQVNTIGEYWLAAASGTPNDLQGVDVLGNLFVVSGGGGTILTSTNGTNWTLQASPVTTFLSSVACFPGGWVAVGDLGTLLTSPDAINWHVVPTGTTNWIYRVRWLDDTLVAVGQNGLLMTSPDGQQWTVHNSHSPAWLTDATRIGNSYYVIGTQGTVLSSTNATDWNNIGTITLKSLYGATAFEGKLLVVGVEGIILRAQVIPLLNPIFYQFSLLPSTNNVITNRFLFSGLLDQRFTLNRSTNLVDWVTGPIFELFDSTNLAPYYEEIVNPSPREFYKPVLAP